MHPLALTPRLNDTRTAKVGEVPGDLRLPLLENLYEVADTYLASVHKVQQSQTSGVGERGE
jgi:hypothetical protein